MDHAPLLCIVRAAERPLLFLIGGLLATKPMISTVLVVSPIGRVDLPIILLLLLGPLAMRLKESSSGLRCLDACVRDCEQISHHLRFLHCNLLHSLDVTDSIVEAIDDFDVLDVWDSVPGVVEMFHVVSGTFIMLLPDGLEGLSNRWMLVHALEVLDEHGT
jgi:hypothetical protein